jgi:LDH2 family malate/lactate/ureidoglycolate dehydrogenase
LGDQAGHESAGEIPTVSAPDDQTVRVLPEVLRAFTQQVLERAGLGAEPAAWLAGVLVANDQRGVLTHGTHQLRQYVPQYRHGELNPEPRPRVVQESPSTAVVDGDGGLGHFAAQVATEVAIAKAKATGTAAVQARNHAHIGAAGSWTRLALPKGCAAMCVSGVEERPPRDPSRGPRSILMVGHSGPICFAIPARDEPPLVLDMGCYVKLHRHRLEEVMGLAPDGLIKILNLGAVTMALGGLLAGTKRLPEPEARPWRAANQGTFLAVWDLACFTPLDDFLTDMDAYVREARALRPLPTHDRAVLAGGLEWERERAWATEGIPLSPDHRDCLDRLAAEAGLDPVAVLV